jgi:hypothetical protein
MEIRNEQSAKTVNDRLLNSVSASTPRISATLAFLPFAGGGVCGSIRLNTASRSAAPPAM